MATVNFGLGQQYQVFQQAIDAAGANGTVICHAGEYHDTAVVRHSGLTIQANGADRVVFDGWVDDVSRPNTTGAYPTNVLPDGPWQSWLSAGPDPRGHKDVGSTSLLLVLANSVTIRNIIFTRSAGRGITAGRQPSDTVSRLHTLTLEGVEITHCRGTALHVYKMDGPITIDDSITHHNVSFYLGDDIPHDGSN